MRPLGGGAGWRCRVMGTGGPWRMHGAVVPAFGIEPKTFRLQGGCSTN